MTSAPMGLPVESDGPGDLFIGSAGDGEFFQGLIDEVRIYGRSLLESEILKLATEFAPPP